MPVVAQYLEHIAHGLLPVEVELHHELHARGMKRLHKSAEFPGRIAAALSAVTRLRRKMKGLAVAPVIDTRTAEGQLLKFFGRQEFKCCHAEFFQIRELFDDAVKSAALHHAAVFRHRTAAHMQAVDDTLSGRNHRRRFLFPVKVRQKERRALHRGFLQRLTEAVVSAEALSVRIGKTLAVGLKLILRAL